MQSLVPNRVFYHIFDRLSPNSTNVYGRYRTDCPQEQRNITQNRQAVLNTLGASQLIILNQVHGHHIIDADLITDFSQEPEADAVVTSKPQLVLGIQTADCVPVLLSDTQGIAIGAAHCGWRSAKANIIKNLVKKLHQKGAKNLKALIGPCIQFDSYEVDHTFYNALLGENPVYNRLFKPSPNSLKSNHYLFDLPGFIRLKLQESGITDIQQIQHDTYSMPEQYPSFRRDTHQGLPKGIENILSTVFIA